MANLPESNEYPSGIYQIETTDPVLGGPPNESTKAGLTNIPAMQLAKRTNWLKSRVDQLVQTVVSASTLVAGIVRLSSSITSPSETTAATSAAVKAVNDKAEERALKATTLTPRGLATGGGDLSASREIDVPAATQAEAEEGVAATKAMTPLRTLQAIIFRLLERGLGGNAPYATNLNNVRTTGWARYDANTAGRPAGVGTAGLMQVIAAGPNRVVQVLYPVNGQSGASSLMRFSNDSGWGAWIEHVTGTFDGGFSAIDWRRLPDGTILQWGRTTTNSAAASGEITVSFPRAWPNACLAVVASDISNAQNKSACAAVAISETRLELSWARVLGTNHQGIRWFAIGH